MSEASSVKVSPWRMLLEIFMLLAFTFTVGVFGVVAWYSRLMAGWCDSTCNWDLINAVQDSIVFILPTLWLGVMAWAIVELCSKRRTATRAILIGGAVIGGYLLAVILLTYLGAQMP